MLPNTTSLRSRDATAPDFDPTSFIPFHLLPSGALYSSEDTAFFPNRLSPAAESCIAIYLTCDTVAHIMLRIYVDADACPVKHEIYQVARRYNLGVTLVAGSRMRLPDEPRVILKVVDQGLDAADDWIVEHVEANDIVITGDIPLAARCIRKGAYVLGITGKPFTAENIGTALATRDLLSELRLVGEITGGPPPFAKRDRSRFLQALDKAINEIRRRS